MLTDKIKEERVKRIDITTKVDSPDLQEKQLKPTEPKEEELGNHPGSQKEESTEGTLGNTEITFSI